MDYQTLSARHVKCNECKRPPPRGTNRRFCTHCKQVLCLTCYTKEVHADGRRNFRANVHPFDPVLGV